MTGFSKTLPSVALVVFTVLASVAPVAAYVGPKDEFGCNTDPRTGRYECHDKKNAPDVKESRFFFKVIRVLDGNTVVVSREGSAPVRIRLIGVLAPYSASRDPYSPESVEASRKRLEKLLLGRKVKLRYEKQKSDAKKRVLAYLHTREGRFVNEVIIREGYARAVRVKGFDKEIMDRLAKAEKEARKARRGLWSDERNLIPTPAKLR